MATLVSGGLKITGGSPAVGKVLTSDAIGVATWATPSSWGLTGNSGTVDGTNFIGTTDNKPLNLRVNNQKAGRIDPTLFNTFYGYQSGNSTTSSNNNANGYQTLFSNTTGSNNTAYGFKALYYNTTGSNNTAIGYSAGVSSGSLLSNTTAIGANAVVNVDNGIVLGTSSNFIGIRQNAPAYALHVQNAYCDGNTWFNASDKNLKENFAPTSSDGSVLEKVLSLPIQYWNYKSSSNARHIGPTAQDFYSIFKLGDNDKSIASVDEGGVALAAIQELIQKMMQLEQLVKSQQQLISSMVNDHVINEKAINGSGFELFQNIPNPSNSDSEIRMVIPENVHQAYLYVYDLQGKPVKVIPIFGRGTTSVKIEGGTFSEGMYLYTLVADSQMTHVFKMILTN